MIFHFRYSILIFGLEFFFIYYYTISQNPTLAFGVLPDIMFSISKIVLTLYRNDPVLNAQFRISKYHFDIHISNFDILTVTFFHFIMVKNLLWHFECYRIGSVCWQPVVTSKKSSDNRLSPAKSLLTTSCISNTTVYLPIYLSLVAF